MDSIVLPGMTPPSIAAAEHLPFFEGADAAVGSLPGAGGDPAAGDPDVASMLAVRGGSEAAFAALVRRHQQPLLNFFVRMGASVESEDLVQETFVRVFRYRESYRPTARFTGFLYHLARNVWADHGRKCVRRERLFDRYRNEVAVAEGGAVPARAGEGPDMQVLLDRLSPKLREVVVLNIFQGLRYQEIAEALEVPLGTVKSRLNLAFSTLRDLIHDP